MSTPYLLIPAVIRRYLSTYMDAQRCNSQVPTRYLKFFALQHDTYGHLLCMLPVARCPLHCAAGWASKRAHMVTCGSFWRAAGRANMRAYHTYGPFGRCMEAGVGAGMWLLVVPSSVLPGESVCELTWLWLLLVARCALRCAVGRLYGFLVVPSRRPSVRAYMVVYSTHQHAARRTRMRAHAATHGSPQHAVGERAYIATYGPS